MNDSNARSLRSPLLLLAVLAACSPPKSTWELRQELPQARHRHVAAGSHNAGGWGRVFVFGGVDGLAWRPSVDAYDPLTNTWDPPGTYPDMPTQRVSPAVATDVTGKIYVIGGSNNGGDLASVDVFDPSVSSGVWSSIPDMPTAREGAGATFGLDGALYVIGGHRRSGSGGFATVERYAGGTWETLPSLPRAFRDDVGAAVGCNGEILAVGAVTWPPQGVCTSETFAYDPNNPGLAWTPREPMPGCLAGDGVVRGADDLIYAINDGDYFAPGTGDVRVYAYNSQQDAWSSVADTNIGGTELGAAVLGPWIFAVGGTSKFAVSGKYPGNRLERYLTVSPSVCDSPPVPFAEDDGGGGSTNSGETTGGTTSDDGSGTTSGGATSDDGAESTSDGGPHSEEHEVLVFGHDDDGAVDRVTVESVGAIDAIGTGDFTFLAQVNALESEQPLHSMIFSNRMLSPDGSIPGVLFFFHALWGSATTMSLGVQLNGQNFISLMTPSVLDGEPHHVAVARESGVLSFYVDGAKIDERILPGDYPVAGGPLSIGHDLVTPSTTGFNGEISHPMIWSRALTGAEIQATMTIPPTGTEPDLVAYWPLTDGDGTQVVTNLTGNGDGVLGSTTDVDDHDPRWVERL